MTLRRLPEVHAVTPMYNWPQPRRYTDSLNYLTPQFPGKYYSVSTTCSTLSFLATHESVFHGSPARSKRKNKKPLLKPRFLIMWITSRSYTQHGNCLA